MIVILLLKYTLALSNLSDNNSPISFPYLYDKYSYKWNNPWYKELPWYIGKDSEGNEDCRWIYYSGILISLKSVCTLWAYALTVLMVAVYFTNFNLAIFNSDFDLSDEKSIQKISDITYDQEKDGYNVHITNR